MQEITIVALIPARSGSRRIPHKNIKYLGDRPLMAWSIKAAQEAQIFRQIIVSSDSEGYGDIAMLYGAEFIHCPLQVAHKDDDPDILWVRHAIFETVADAFAILRPTSPFRTADTIRRAWAQFLHAQPCDSLRAVEPARQHPGKMWLIQGKRLQPVLPWRGPLAPWHSSPTQTLPAVYVQNASLEIAWTKTVIEQGTIAGCDVIPFFTEGLEGFDINSSAEFGEAERIAQEVLCQRTT